MEKVKISVNQFTVLVLMYTLGSSVLIIPSSLANYAKSNAWISSLFGLMVGLMFLFLYVKISALFPDKTMVEIYQAVLGKWLGNLLSLLFLYAVFISATGNLKEIGDFFTTQVLVETPIHAILVITIIAVIYVIRKGLEVMVRTCEIFFPWTVFFLIILVLFLIPEMEIENLDPNFAKGVGPIFGAAFPFICFPFSQLVVFLMILPYVNNVAKARKGLFIGALLGGLGVTIIMIMCLGVLGADFTSRNQYPTYILGKKISIRGFLERIEVVVAISWIFSTFFKLSINLFVILLGISQILKMNDFKPLIFPLGFLLLTYSMVHYPNILYFKEVLTDIGANFLTFFLLLPMIVFVVALLKKKIGNQSM